MRKIDEVQFVMPYSAVVEKLIDSIFDALYHLCKVDDREGEVKDDDLIPFFNWLDQKRPQILDGSLVINTMDSEVLGGSRRIAQLTNVAFAHVSNKARTIRDGGPLLLPSPLKIAIDYLTVPSEPASQSYALATLRAYLFQLLRIAPQRNGRSPAIVFGHVRNALISAHSHVARRPYIIPHDPRTESVATFHMLAMKGLLLLSFGMDETARSARLSYCCTKNIVGQPPASFCKSVQILTLPDVSEVVNLLWGVPLPIHGAETVFFGGLNFAADSSLVAAVEGAPGTGKTSLALALAAVLAPLGTRTFFITAEEKGDDLRSRLSLMTPTYLERLSIFPRNHDEWFRALEVVLRSDKTQSPSFVLKELMSEMNAIINYQNGDKINYQNSDNVFGNDLPLPCPLMVVLDGIQNYYSWSGKEKASKDNHYSTANFIEDCRKLGVLVLITAAEKRRELESIEYLVDVVFDLHFREYADPSTKPSRTLVLRKTRHQISRPGAHIYHLSGPKGFRISPQVASQMDRHSRNRSLDPNTKQVIDVLNRHVIEDEWNKVTQWNFLDLYERSHILLHGRASAGKASLALKILLAPLLSNHERKIINRLCASRRVLVLSFLYPDSAYQRLRRNLIRNVEFEYDLLGSNAEWSEYVKGSTIEVLYFYPGFLNSEDMLSKTLNALDKAELEGKPFTGVLLDGLHNALQQFPRLGETKILWPMLFGILRTRDLTVVTTHTTFSVKAITHVDDEQDMALRLAIPMLHTLVEKADFFLDIQTHDKSQKPLPRTTIAVQSSIGQPLPHGEVFWHREKMVIYREKPTQQYKLVLS